MLGSRIYVQAPLARIRRLLNSRAYYNLGDPATFCWWVHGPPDVEVPPAGSGDSPLYDSDYCCEPNDDELFGEICDQCSQRNGHLFDLGGIDLCESCFECQRPDSSAVPLNEALPSTGPRAAARSANISLIHMDVIHGPRPPNTSSSVRSALPAPGGLRPNSYQVRPVGFAGWGGAFTRQATPP